MPPLRILKSLVWAFDEQNEWCLSVTLSGVHRGVLLLRIFNSWAQAFEEKKRDVTYGDTLAL